MITWGMVGNSHDASLACFINDRPVWASLAKDFSDVTNDPDFNWTQISVAIQAYGIPDKIVWYEKPFWKTTRQWWAGQGWLAHENNIKNYLSQWDLSPSRTPIEYAWHHHAHASYGYYTSGFDNATILCMDSIGEWESLTIWTGEGNKLKKVYSQKYPHSVGLFYSAMTQRCGLIPNEEEYKVAHMAKKGSDKYVGLVKQALINDDLNGYMPGVHFKHNLHKGAKWLLPECEDLNSMAFATQSIYEDILESNSNWCLKNFTSRNLIITGGCALNKQANNKIESDWDNLYVPKNPGDPGSCIGAVASKLKKHLDYSEKVWYNKV